MGFNGLHKVILNPCPSLSLLSSSNAVFLLRVIWTIVLSVSKSHPNSVLVPCPRILCTLLNNIPQESAAIFIKDLSLHHL